MRYLLIILLFSLSLFAGIGKVTYLKGEALLTRDGKQLPIKVGLQLNNKDSIATKKNSLVKLLFSDKSAISVGSKSDFSIEDYLYGEKKKSIASFKMRKGVFRAITGKIAKASPDKFKLKTKTVTIGIRGTIFSGIVTDEKEEFLCEKGAIYVSSRGVSIDIAKGYKTSVARGAPPRPPKKYSNRDLQNILGETGGWRDKECKN